MWHLFSAVAIFYAAAPGLNVLGSMVATVDTVAAENCLPDDCAIVSSKTSMIPAVVLLVMYHA